MIPSEEVRLLLLLLAGIGFLLQWDSVLEALREARKGGDDDSEEKSPPPQED